MTDIIGKEGT